jgi:hypothetical protein
MKKIILSGINGNIPEIRLNVSEDVFKSLLELSEKMNDHKVITYTILKTVLSTNQIAVVGRHFNSSLFSCKIEFEMNIFDFQEYLIKKCFGYGEWPLKANEIISNNGWIDETGKEYGICSTGGITIEINENGSIISHN